MNYPNPHGPSCPWYDLAATQGAPNIKWCEETLCQWISEPANTWSNLGYLIVAVAIMFISSRNKYNFKLKQFGPIIFFMGAMSFIYHLSNFYGSQILDFVGMFFLVGWAIGMNLIRLGRLKDSQLIPFNLIFSTLFTVVVHIMYIKEIKFQMLMLISAFIIVITEIMAYRIQKVDLKWFITSLALLGMALGFSLSDGMRIWCHPENHGWFAQGHALWHWVAAIGMFTIFKHYSQPKLKPQENA